MFMPERHTVRPWVTGVSWLRRSPPSRRRPSARSLTSSAQARVLVPLILVLHGRGSSGRPPAVHRRTCHRPTVVVIHGPARRAAVAIVLRGTDGRRTKCAQRDHTNSNCPFA